MHYNFCLVINLVFSIYILLVVLYMFYIPTMHKDETSTLFGNLCWVSLTFNYKILGTPWYMIFLLPGLWIVISMRHFPIFSERKIPPEVKHELSWKVFTIFHLDPCTNQCENQSVKDSSFVSNYSICIYKWIKSNQIA